MMKQICISMYHHFQVLDLTSKNTLNGQDVVKIIGFPGVKFVLVSETGSWSERGSLRMI